MRRGQINLGLSDCPASGSRGICYRRSQLSNIPEKMSLRELNGFKLEREDRWRGGWDWEYSSR